MFVEGFIILLIAAGLFRCLFQYPYTKPECEACVEMPPGKKCPRCVIKKPDLQTLERRVGRAVFELYRIRKLDPRTDPRADPNAKLDKWQSRLAWAKKIRDTSLKDLEDAKIVWADLSQKEE